MSKLSILSKTTYFLIAIVVILATAYLFGHPLLQGSLKGNDTGDALTYITWFDKWFPRQPFWFPLQGGGVALHPGSKNFTYYIVVLIHRLTNLTLIQSTRLLAFLSVPLIALGIYAFTWLKLKSQTLALIAAVFYPLSQAAWHWLLDLGLYAQMVSLIFVPPTLIFFDLYLEKVFKEIKDKKRKLWFFLSVLFLIISFSSHFAVGILLVEFLLFYVLLYSLFIKPRIKNLVNGFLASFKIIFFGLLLSAFWMFPFFRIISITNRGGLAFWEIKSIPYFTIPHLFGLESIKTLPSDIAMWHVFFAAPVLILSGIAIVGALFRRNWLVIIWGIISFIFIIQTALPNLWPALVSRFAIFWTATYVRAIIIPMIFLPTIAAFGVYSIAKSLVFLLKIPAKLFPKIVFGSLLKFLKPLTFSVLVIFITALSIIYLKHTPPDTGLDPCYQGYGHGHILIDYCHPWQILLKPKLILSNEMDLSAQTAQELTEKIPLKYPTRVDISAHQGGILKYFSIYSDASVVNLYGYGMSLNHLFWAYQQWVFYNIKHEKGESTPTQINEMAKWFGIEYVFLDKEKNPIERYEENKWPVVFTKEKQDTIKLSLEVRHFTEATELTSWSQKPSILIIGQFDKRAYEETFKLATLGAIPYDQTLLVEGRDSGRIDDYTLEELKKFDIVFLYGYTYKNKEKAFSLIDQYLKEGGKVLIETGWQYVSPDWQWESTVDFLPVKRLEWNYLEKEKKPEFIDKTIFKNLDSAKFAPFIWEDQPWGASIGKIDTLREWANPLIKVDNDILMAGGDYGKGKIIWSGMNLIGHALYHKNEEEYKLLSNLISLLYKTPEDSEIQTIEIKRDYPDKVEFTLGQSTDETTSLYWRESYIKDWKAHLKQTTDNKQQTTELNVYRAGPEYMLMRIPPVQEGAKVVLEYKPSLIVILSRILSILTFAFLAIYLFREDLLIKLVRPIKKSFSKISAIFFPKKLKVWWEKE